MRTARGISQQSNIVSVPTRPHPPPTLAARSLTTSTEYIRNGDTVEMWCSANSEFATSYNWLIDGVFWQTTSEFMLQFPFDLGFKLEMTFTCQVTDEGGTSLDRFGSVVIIWQFAMHYPKDISSRERSFPEV